jgi:hypothetical protein
MLGVVNRVELRGRARATAPASAPAWVTEIDTIDAELVGTLRGSSANRTP